MWQDKANCGNADPDLFFSARKRDRATALAYCSACPVKSECLAFAIDKECVDGIFGGLLADERKELTNA